MNTEKEKSFDSTKNDSEKRREKFPVLVVEDDPVARLLLAEILENAGYKPVLAENGRKAFELFRKNFFPIVLSDWEMPEMDGLELCRAIRSVESPDYAFIILLTSMDSGDDASAGLDAGADDYLYKPLDERELKARIETGFRILELESSLRKADREVRELTVVDPLTGCFNRSYIDGRLADDVKRAARYRHPLSLLMLDIDHFIEINAAHGSRAGDLVLVEFAKTIQGSIRDKVDWLCRYGGDEFVVVLPETGPDGADALAERLRAKISRLAVRFEDVEIKISASFGVASFEKDLPADAASPEKLIADADRALNLAKQKGGDRTEKTSVETAEKSDP